jgi:hypothetical protein
MMRAVSWVGEWLIALAVAIGALVFWRALVHPDDPFWQPSLLACLATFAASAAVTRFALLLCEEGPGPEFEGWLYCDRYVAVAWNPLVWEIWPCGSLDESRWPRVYMVQWLFLAIIWQYSTQPMGDEE